MTSAMPEPFKTKEVPEAYVAQGAAVKRLEAEYLEAISAYRAETRRLHLKEGVYIQALADASPFSYETVRNWVQGRRRPDKAPRLIDDRPLF